MSAEVDKYPDVIRTTRINKSDRSSSMVSTVYLLLHRKGSHIFHAYSSLGGISLCMLQSFFNVSQIVEYMRIVASNMG